MTTAAFPYTAPAQDVRDGHGAALAALRAAAARSADLWRRTPDGQAPVPGLSWTAAETAAHVVGDLRDETNGLTGAPRADVDLGSGPASKRSAAVNAQHLATVRERDMRRLAQLLDEEVARYLRVASDADDTADVNMANGLV